MNGREFFFPKKLDINDTPAKRYSSRFRRKLPGCEFENINFMKDVVMNGRALILTCTCGDLRHRITNCKPMLQINKLDHFFLF